MNDLPMIIQHTPPPEPELDDNIRPIVVNGLVIVFLFFGVLGGWAGLAPMESAVTATARVVVVGDRKVVQSAETGILHKILIEDGAVVEKDQVLFLLDDSEARTQVNILTIQHSEILASIARYSAERDGDTKITYPQKLLDQKDNPDIAAVMQNHNNLFAMRQKAWEGQVSVLRKRISQLDKQVSGSSAQENAQRVRHNLLQQELRSVRALQQEGFASKNRVLALERELAALEGSKGEYSGNVARIRESIGETELQIIQLQKDRVAEISSKLSDNQTRLLDIVERLRQAKEVLGRIEILAPEGGRVVDLRKTTEGSVVGKGEVLLEIVPHDKKLIFEGYIRPDEIEDVRVGLLAKVVLTAYKTRNTPTLPGEVTFVSADSSTQPGTGVKVYTIKVDVSLAELQRVPEVTIVPGMPAIIMIPSTVKRTVLDYLLDPISIGMHKAFREK